MDKKILWEITPEVAMFVGQALENLPLNAQQSQRRSEIIVSLNQAIKTSAPKEEEKDK